MFTVYATSPKIGSPAKMHELLTLVSHVSPQRPTSHCDLLQAAQQAPVEGNAEGSYLTMRSKNGLIFGVINVRFSLILHANGLHSVIDHWKLW